jgi:bifunctional UDP-N-acetylglucosamine pyrophosphorylase/glucosamine-1-phosphate N-acetyltransferase
MAELAVVILAAGKGTRMLSRRQKILHEVGGQPMVSHVFESALKVADLPPLLVVGPGEDGVQELFGERASYVLQPEQLGTGHATMMAAPLLEGRSRQVLVTYADMPLLRADTMVDLAERQRVNGAAVVMLTVMGEPSSTFGRVVRGQAGQVVEIVEVAEARQRPEAQTLLAILEHNAGVYCFDADWLWQNLPDLPLRQARGGQEYYLTDLVGLAVSQDQPVEAQVVEDADECLGAGTRAEPDGVHRSGHGDLAQYLLAGPDDDWPGQCSWPQYHHSRCDAGRWLPGRRGCCRALPARRWRGRLAIHSHSRWRAARLGSGKVVG